MREIVNSKNAPSPVGPYNQAIRCNGTLYVSGQIGLDPVVNKIVGEDIKVQAEQVLKNHAAILREAGMDFKNVVKVSVFITDINDFTLVNEVYGRYFTDSPPAREAMEVSKLPLGARIMISLIASE